MPTERRVGNIVVTDAGPLLHLAELDALDVLSDFQQILVVPAIRDEVLKHQPSVFSRSCNMTLTDAVSHADEVTALIPLYTLHRGEREALDCCMRNMPALFLTDDTAARLAAQALRITAHGTIGLLVRAVRKRHRTIEEVISLLSSIPQRSTLHVRPTLLREVIEQVRHHGSG